MGRYAAWLLTIEDTYYNDGTPIINKEFVEEQLEKGADPETIQQEYYCSFKASASGAWFKHSMKKVDDEERITFVPQDIMIPTYGFYDLAQGGIDLYTCILAQFPKDEKVKIIDYFEMQGCSSGEFIDTVTSKHTVPIHFLPWDGGHTQDYVTESTSRVNKLKKEKGINIIKVDRGKNVADDVEICMRLMNYCWFDEGKCKKLINHLRNYKKKKNQSTGVYTNTEARDQHTHAAAAFRTLGLAWDRKIIPKHGGSSLREKIKSITAKTICNLGYN
jgi:hypothetical protein